MEPITTALIASSLLTGFAYLGEQLVGKTLLDPVLDPVAEKLRAYLPKVQSQDERQVAAAVQGALQTVGAPAQAENVHQFILRTGFDQFTAQGNAPLRHEIARAVLVMTAPDVALIPDTIFQWVRWPNSERPLLARFLYEVRRNLATLETLRPLIEYADREAVRQTLRALQLDASRTADATERSARYLQALLLARGIAADKPDAQALGEYLDLLRQLYSHISFLFVQPMGNRQQLRSEADLDAVFVPLQVQDPADEEKRSRKGQRQATLTADEVEAQRPTLTINDVVARYPLFLLLGAPGSGKTTLLRHLTTLLARGEAATTLALPDKPLLPILVPLRNFGRFLAAHSKEFTNPAPAALRTFIEEYFREYDLGLPADFFQRRLREGGCLLLLDGLDEVADRDLRAQVAQMVSAFIRHYARQGNRFGLASRPKGYDEVAAYLPRPVIGWVQPLQPEGRDTLVTKLLSVLESNPVRCREDVRVLLKDLRTKSKVDELSRNPLFCTTLVLVYKYRGTTLPERRVDVYHELVELLLGFWETHKAHNEGVADVRELVLIDGTGRDFLDERDAVEAKRRALIALADWLQRRGLAEAPESRAAAQLARFFRTREGATRQEDALWARRFLTVAHQRSGLFIETQPGVYAFSHQNFREYLAATALIDRRDADLLALVQRHAADPWWEEVILLAAAHPKFSDLRREDLVRTLLDAGHIVLAGRCTVDAGARLPAPLRRTILQQLESRMKDPSFSPQERYAAGETLDELGWLPPDLDAWVHCPATADNGADLLVPLYPITNTQFARFVESDGYTNPLYWGGEASEGWRWRIEAHPDYRGNEPITQPEYWDDVRFGRERRGYPVVGVSWYEASAFAAWLTALVQRVREGDGTVNAAEAKWVEALVQAGVTVVRLPTEEEWERLAGGVADKKRFAWDPPAGPATAEQEAILARANVSEAGLKGTSPVAMYPLGVSQPNKLSTMTGNIWRWTDSWYNKETADGGRVVRGGSWYRSIVSARCAIRYGYGPDLSRDNVGCWVVAPIGSGF